MFSSSFGLGASQSTLQPSLPSNYPRLCSHGTERGGVGWGCGHLSGMDLVPVCSTMTASWEIDTWLSSSSSRFGSIPANESRNLPNPTRASCQPQHPKPQPTTPNPNLIPLLPTCTYHHIPPPSPPMPTQSQPHPHPHPPPPNPHPPSHLHLHMPPVPPLDSHRDDTCPLGPLQKVIRCTRPRPRLPALLFAGLPRLPLLFHGQNGSADCGMLHHTAVRVGRRRSWGGLGGKRNASISFFLPFFCCC